MCASLWHGVIVLMGNTHIIAETADEFDGTLMLVVDMGEMVGDTFWRD